MLSGTPTAFAAAHDLQQWSLLTLRADGPHQWRVYAEVQPRVGNDISTLDRLILRPALGYQVTKQLSIWQGYAWTPSFTPRFNDEHRLFQQLLHEARWKRLGVTNRTRLEQRFIEGASGTSVRGRHMLRLSVDLDRQKRWALVGYNELFVNLNDTPGGPAGGYDQNRIYVGVSRQLSPSVQAEAGYLWNPVRREGIPDRINHVVLLGLNIRR